MELSEEKKKRLSEEAALLDACMAEGVNLLIGEKRLGVGIEVQHYQEFAVRCALALYAQVNRHVNKQEEVAEMAIKYLMEATDEKNEQRERDREAFAKFVPSVPPFSQETGAGIAAEQAGRCGHASLHALHEFYTLYEEALGQMRADALLDTFVTLRKEQIIQDNALFDTPLENRIRCQHCSRSFRISLIVSGDF